MLFRSMHDITNTASLPYMAFYDYAQGYVANVQVNDIQTGKNGVFEATYTGFTTTVLENVFYSNSGGIVTLKFLTKRATSNSTSFVITGLPTNLWPIRQQTCAIGLHDNGLDVYGVATISEADGGIYLGVGAGGSNFTASGLKGTNSFTITYSLT